MAPSHPALPSGADEEVWPQLQGQPPRLLKWFVHPISNAMAEGFNSVIQATKSAAQGFRNFEHYHERILFLLGKFDLSLA